MMDEVHYSDGDLIILLFNNFAIFSIISFAILFVWIIKTVTEIPYITEELGDLL